MPTATPAALATPALADFRRIVVKVGSSLLVESGAGHVREQWLTALCEDIAKLHGEGRELLVVSSGAIALGRGRLKLPPGPLKLEDSQAAAAVGQIELARIWSEMLGRHDIRAGQILLTLQDTEERRRYLNAALDARTAVRIARAAGDQRKRHRRHQRDPLTATTIASPRASLPWRAPIFWFCCQDIDGLYDAPPSTNPNAS